MATDRRSLRGWFEFLDDPKREMTLSELMAVMVFNQREYTRLMLDEVRAMRQAAEHTEGMLGAIDALSAAIAERSGLPYAESSAVREALDLLRERKRLASGQGS